MRVFTSATAAEMFHSRGPAPRALRTAPLRHPVRICHSPPACSPSSCKWYAAWRFFPALKCPSAIARDSLRSEEHTSELQSRFDLVCRLLLEKKKDDGRCRTSHCGR